MHSHLFLTACLASLCAAENDSPTSPPTEVLGLLPSGLTSFGAATLGEDVYILGGYSGAPHDYSRDGQHGDFFVLDARDVSETRALPRVEPLQSVALVAHRGGLIRIGGMRAYNAAGEPADLRSLDEVARFDPATGLWSDLPSLPSGRSSHDAVVVDDSVIVVVGGWRLGEGDARFQTDALTIDLTAEAPTWRSIPAPFQARALATATLVYESKSLVVAIGGLGADRKPTAAVRILDPATGSWSTGPDFPGDAFGVAATTRRGEVLASGSDGTVWALAQPEGPWRAAGELSFGRFFHRMVATEAAQTLFLGGIAGMDGSDRIRIVERLAGDAEDAVRIHACEAALPGPESNRQGAFVAGRRLYLFGGNASPRQHDFEPDTFGVAGLGFDLGSYSTRALAPFPVGRQAMESVVLGERVLVGGGFGHDGEVARSHAETFVYDLERDQWSRGPRLDRPRSQFCAQLVDGDVWVLGGHDYDPRRVDDEAFLFPAAVLMADARDLAAGFQDSGLRLPRGRRAFASATLDGRIYLVGGMGPGFEALEVVDVLDTSLGTWSTIASPATRRVGASLVAHEGRLYLIGGTLAGESDRSGAAPSIEVYCPEADTWSVHVPDVGSRLRHARATSFGGRLLIWTTDGRAEGAIQLRYVNVPQRRALQASQ